jgi:aromatic ring hydroxylase
LDALLADAQAIDDELTELLSGTPAEYASKIYSQCISTLSSTLSTTVHATSLNPSPSATVDMEVISDVLAGLNAMESPVGRLLNKVLQIDGVGKYYRSVEGTSKRLREVVRLIEDIYCGALMGANELEEMYRRGELQFQS